MSIDRIGKGPSGIGPPEQAGIGPTPQPAAESFRVAEATAAQPSGSLDRVRSGETTLAQYLDDKVEVATKHLVGRVRPEQLEWIQQNMREQMASDPVLVDLVKAATGSVPTAKE